MKELVNKYKLKKYTPLLLGCLLLSLAAIPQLAYAVDSFDWLKNFIASFFNLLSAGIGMILIFLFKILISLAQYNGFITSPAVTTGWVIVRDICNMFFILILLVIAFATILRLDGYNWKKDLPRLLIYAILINFSRTICGLMIDFSQVVMLTFVNAFAENGANNLTYIFQVDKFSSLNGVDTSTAAGGDFFTKVLVGSIASFFAILITAIMTVAIITTLLMRMVYIWIYVILSPAAFLLNSYAGGKSYYGQWMSKFSKELIGGPVLAFFLWLSLTVAGNTDNGMGAMDNSVWSINGGVELFTNGPFQKYIIVIGLLYGGMQVASTIGGAAGKAAGTAMKRSDAVFDKSKKLAVGGAVLGADYLNRKVAGGWGKDGRFGTGIDLNVGRQMERLKRGFAESKKKDMFNINKASNRNLGMGGVAGGVLGFTSDDWYDNYFGFDGLKRVAKGGIYGQGTKKRLDAEAASKTEEERRLREQAGNILGSNEYTQKQNKFTDDLLGIRTQRAGLVKEESDIDVELNKLGPELQALRKKEKSKLTEDDIEKLTSLDEKRKSLTARKKDLGNEKNGLDGAEEELIKERAEFITLRPISQDEADKQRSDLLARADTLKSEALKSRADATAGILSESFYEANLRSSIAEAGKKEGFESEDEGLKKAEAAEFRGDTAALAAITKQMAKVGGMNALLEANGYNASAGMSLQELKKITAALKEKHGNNQAAIDAELQKKRGFNDFMRDKFSAKMGEKGMLALQNDIASLAEGGSHQYMAKTVKLDESTRELTQTSGEERAKVMVGERRKQENEGNIRKFGRFGYGDEINGEFKWNEEGMTTFIDNLHVIAKEIDGGRFNRNAAVKIVGGDGTLNELTKALKAIEAQGLLPTSKFYKSADDFTRMIKNYAKGSAGDDAKKVSSIVHENIGNPYN